MNKPVPTQEAYEEAKKHPGGWVYVIDAKYKDQEDIPPEGIVGAWQVDETGCLTDNFQFNKNYKSELEPASKKPWWKF